MLNRKIKNNTGLIGVTAHLSDGKFYLRANFRVNKTKRLRFNCPDTPFNRILAALAHDKFVLQAGEEEYAPLNFPRWSNEPMRSILLTEDLSKLKERSKDVRKQEVRNAEHRTLNVKRRMRNRQRRERSQVLRFCRKNSHHSDEAA
jgi:hypothetical protein